MQFTRITTAKQLEPLRETWNELARDVPFRTYEWLTTWWKHYGGEDDERGGRLFVVQATDASGRVIALAPWYVQHRVSQGRLLRFMGTGEVYSDYLTVLCRRGYAAQVTRGLAEWLCGAASDQWDTLELTGFDHQDRVVLRLIESLSARLSTTHHREGLSCWRIELPRVWDDYVARLSKQRRKRIRRADRELFATGRAVLRVAASPAEVEQGMRILVDLHQRRWQSQARPGCFASAPFSAFLHEVAPQMAAAGRLQLCWLEIDGQPVAVDFNLKSNQVIYAYQAGLDPAALRWEPGRLLTMTILRGAVERGYTYYDLLRGNEPYKAHWLAAPRPTVEVRFAAPRVGARLRHNIWIAGLEARDWLKSGLTLVQPG